MSKPNRLADTLAPALDEAHWRAAAEEGLRLAARRWQVPLDNITEITLVDADGPCYLFKAIYFDESGQRFTAAVRMPKGLAYSSPLSMAMLCPAPAASGLVNHVAAPPAPDLWPGAKIRH